MDVLVLRSVDHGEPDDGACDFLAFWFPGIPMWIFASGYAVLGLFVIWIGNKGFDRLENVLAVIKIAAIVMFLVIAAAALMGWLKGGSKLHVPGGLNAIFPAGGMGMWSSLILRFMPLAESKSWGYGDSLEESEGSA